MKTTPDGLTYLINMLVDVVNLQRKAQGTPGAICDVDLNFIAPGKAVVEFTAEVNVAAPPLTTLSADNNRMLTPSDIQAAERALGDSGFPEEATAQQAAKLMLAAVGLGLPGRDDAG